MKNLLWCSPHTPTEEQLTSLNNMGAIVFLKDVAPKLMNRLSNTPSVRSECKILADEISEIAETLHAKIVQLGGSPLFLIMAAGVIDSSRMIFADSEKIIEDIPQQETLEIAAEKIYPRHKGLTTTASNKIMLRRCAWIKGAKWMQEKMYNEEDMRKAFITESNSQIEVDNPYGTEVDGSVKKISTFRHKGWI